MLKLQNVQKKFSKKNQAEIEPEPEGENRLQRYLIEREPQWEDPPASSLTQMSNPSVPPIKSNKESRGRDSDLLDIMDGMHDEDEDKISNSSDEHKTPELDRNSSEGLIFSHDEDNNSMERLESLKKRFQKKRKSSSANT